MSSDLAFDISGDGTVDAEDRRVWVEEAAYTYFGDADMDGEFNSKDLVKVFSTALYESGASATWAQGDWNGDGFFTSADLTLAFQSASYEQGPRSAEASTVPEPSDSFVMLCGLFSVFAARRRSRNVQKNTTTVDVQAVKQGGHAVL